MGEHDVAVIGAGIIGASIGYELALRGVAVTILEARAPGQGATQAAAGMLAPYLEGIGKPILPLAAASLGMYDAFVQRVTADSGCVVEYQRNGSLQVITADQSAEPLRTLQAACGGTGVRCTLMDGRQIQEMEPSLTPDVVAGAFIPDHGVVVPRSLADALLAAAMKRGATVAPERRVEHVGAEAHGFALQTSAGHVHARRVVVAAGSWSGQVSIDGVPPLPVRPVRGQLVRLKPATESPRQIVWGSRCYAAPSPDGFLAIGATMEESGFDERVTAAAVRDLLDAAADLIPSLGRATFAGARVGLRPATPDDMPIMGRSHILPGLFYATGHFRNGILLAPVTARVMADLVLDSREDPLLAAASPQRFGRY